MSLAGQLHKFASCRLPIRPPVSDGVIADSYLATLQK